MFLTDLIFLFSQSLCSTERFAQLYLPTLLLNFKILSHFLFPKAPSYAINVPFQNLFFSFYEFHFFVTSMMLMLLFFLLPVLFLYSLNSFLPSVLFSNVRNFPEMPGDLCSSHKRETNDN